MNIKGRDLLLPLLLIGVLVSGYNGVQSNLAELETAIHDRLAGEEGIFSLAFIPIERPAESLYIDADRPFHAASTMKTPVMVEVFRKAELGHFSLSDSIEIRNRFISIVDGSEFSLDLNPEGNDPIERRVGERETIYNLTHAMITYSSNIATNLILQLADPSDVTRTMRRLGADRIEVLRGLFDMKAFERDMNNTTTARDLAVIFEKLARGEAVSQEVDAVMIQILEDQFYRNIIPAYLTEEVAVANKTGSITGVVHDSGIVTLPDGRRYVLVFLSGDLPDNDHGRTLGAEISRLIYDHISNL